MSEYTKPYEDKMTSAVRHLEKELAAVRAGRANPAVLDKIAVDYYGTPTPIQQVAAVAVAEARVLTITPWDASLLRPIEKAILTSELGINPTNDGRVIRLTFPAPTEDRRRQLTKDVQHMGEEAKVAVRNVRRDANDSLKKLEKEKTITEDEQKKAEAEVQKLTDKFVADADKRSQAKEKEIMDIVRQLPTGYSKVFQMAVIEGYSHKEIAERMGIEPHSSSSQLARAKAMLRKMISKRMLAVVTIIFISIPICRVLWRKDKAKEKNNHTAQVKNEDKGQTSLGNRQVEEKQATKDQITKDQSQKDKEVDVVISNIYPRVVQAIVDTIPATDTLQSPSTLDNIRIAGIIDDSIFSDTMRIRWHEYDKPLITEETVLPKKHHWQLLAAGSLGSALAQNAYRMLTGNSGGGLPDVDGPDGPVAPDKFSTWDEYYRYLQIKEHEGLSEEEKALMEIAFNNKNNINNNIKNDGKIVEHEHHDKPISFGISVTKTLGKNGV